MVLPLIIGGFAVVDTIVELATGKDIVEYITGVDVIGEAINAGADLLGIEHDDYTEDDGGLLDVDIPTLPEVITGNNDASVINPEGDGTAFESSSSVDLSQVQEWLQDMADDISAALNQMSSDISDALTQLAGHIDMWGWTVLGAVCVCIVIGLASMLGTWKNGRRLKLLRRGKR